MNKTGVIVGLLALAAPVFADTVGLTGAIVGLREVNSNSDRYALLRGSIWIEESPGQLQEYRWGGSACPGKDLTEDEVANLARNLDRNVRIIPIFKNGQGGSRCLVEFIITDRRHADDINPEPF